MNRREFIQLTALALPALMWKGTNNMPTFSELMDKLAQNQSLNPLERAILRDEVRAIEEIKNLAKGWVQPGSANAKFVNPNLENPSWVGQVLHPLQTVKTNLSVNNATTTYISWDPTLETNRGKAFRRDDTNPDRIYVLSPGYNWHIVGTAHWASNATGYRQLGVTYYDEAGNSLGSQNYHIMDPSATQDSYIPVADFVMGVGFSGISYFRVYVAQTSGGALTLTDIRLTYSLG